jgi:hypothetical protein
VFFAFYDDLCYIPIWFVWNQRRDRMLISADDYASARLQGAFRRCTEQEAVAHHFWAIKRLKNQAG